MQTLATLAVHASSSTPSWVGSVPTWALVIMGLFVAYRVSRGGGGAAVQELSVSNRVLTDALDHQRDTASAQAKQIAILESKTDVVLAVTPLLAEHEKKASERHEALVHVLEAMSARLEK